MGPARVPSTPLVDLGPWWAERQRSVANKQHHKWRKNAVVKFFEVVVMEHWRRIGLVIYAIGWFILFVSFWNLRYEDLYGAIFWPFWYLATAIVTLLFDLVPSNFQLYRLSGGMGVVGLLSRVGGIYVTYATGGDYVLLGWQVPVAAVVYSMAASGLWYWWRAAIGPWHRAKKGDKC